MVRAPALNLYRHLVAAEAYNCWLVSLGTCLTDDMLKTNQPYQLTSFRLWGNTCRYR